jgi:hypothetical protein
MEELKKKNEKNRYLETDELMIALTSLVGLLTVAVPDIGDSRLSSAIKIANQLIKKIKGRDRPVIIVEDGLVQNVIGLERFYILDFDSLTDMTCPFCLKRDLPFPHEEIWICPECGVDLNAYQYDDASHSHQTAARIVYRIRKQWASDRFVHGAPGERKQGQ